MVAWLHYVSRPFQHTHYTTRRNAKRTLEELLHHHLVARAPEGLVEHHLLEARERLLLRRGEQHALARRQARGLDHHGEVCRLHEGLRRRVLLEVAVLGRGDVVPRHEVLRVRLGRLQLRGRRRGAEAGEARRGELVHRADHQGRLGPHHHQAHALLLGEAQQRGHVLRADGQVADLGVRGGRAAVARRDKDALDAGRLGQLERDGVLAAAGAEEEHVERRGGGHGEGEGGEEQHGA